MKRKSDVAVMWKEAGILFAITLIAGILLGFVYELTKEPIRIQQEKAVQEACAAVFPGEQNLEFCEIELAVGNGAAGLESLELPQGVEIGSVYEAVNQSGQFLGYVVESTSTQGYGGNIVLYVGVAADGTVGGVSILDISETAGLGMEAPKVLAPQFAGKRVEQFSYTKTGSRTDSEVDAISAATVTTKAVVNAVNGALKTAQILLQGGGAHE
ncbi:MAG: RnfABCDGE type electron transport complex subunit G [Acetatifactor sp.]|nr:RnfABCDGE type electron transport complex subunit G [Acetatifactor sp.]